MEYWEILKDGVIVMGLFVTQAQIVRVLDWYRDRNLDRCAIKTDIETGNPKQYINSLAYGFGR